MAGSLRVTQQSISAGVLAGLHGNLTRLAATQQKLSSGKEISKPSDSPTGAVAAMQFRSDVAAAQQHSRNADDGIGWLTAIDSALTGTMEQVNRVRGLVLQGMSSGSYGSIESREALAVEIDTIRSSLIGVANTTYLDRPVFGGTTAGVTAYDSAGTYAGNGGQVERTVGPNTRVRVDLSGPEAFGTGNEQLFTVLSNISSHLRAGTELTNDLSSIDTAARRLQSGLSSVGARYNQVSRMRQTAEDNVLSLKTQLSDVEDVDLPKTITELQLQQTAYQAALAAGARVVQPSLVDFLR